MLYLVELDQNQDDYSRLPLPLNDLTETHEKLKERLTQREATIEVYENANRFIAALTKVRESLGNEVDWADAHDLPSGVAQPAKPNTFSINDT